MTIGSRRRITREALFAVIPEYAEATSREAAERMFERDKAEIHALGLDLTTEVDPWDDAVVHYRIPRGDRSLGPLELTGQEYTVLLAASRAWDDASAGGAARRVRAKLLSMGLEPDPDLVRRTPQGSVESLPVLAPLLEAVTAGASVAFRYRAAGGQLAERRVEPWVVGVHDGHWYVLGFDLDRQARRLFRASRIESYPRRGPLREHPVPADADLASALTGADGRGGEVAGAVLRIEPYKALGLRDAAGAAPAEPEVRLERAHRGATLRAVLGSARWSELVSPQSWRAELAEICEQIVRRHEGAPDLTGLQEAPVRPRPAIRVPATSTDHLSRLLAEASYVLSRGEVSLDQMAQEFAVSRRRLIEDLQILFVCGDLGAGWEDLIDVEWEDGWVRVRNADALDTPLRLGPAEVTALLAGLAALTPAQGDEARLVASARAKLMGLLARPAHASEERATSASSVDSADPPQVERGDEGGEAQGVMGSRRERIVAGIQEALDRRAGLVLRYSPPDREGTAVRRVLPLRLETAGAHGYLRAMDESARAERTFRLDRIVELLNADAPTITAGPAAPQATGATAGDPGTQGSPSQLAHAWLRLEAPAAWIAEAFSAAEIRELPDGSGIAARLEDPVRSALIDAVLEARGCAELLEPAGLRDEIVTLAARAAARHRGSEPVG